MSRIDIVRSPPSLTLLLDSDKSQPPAASDVVRAARTAFNAGRTKPLPFRKRQLKQLARLLTENETAIVDALAEDLRKNPQETIILEIQPLLTEIAQLLGEIDALVKPERTQKSMVFFMDRTYIYKDPYGVVLILSAWNFPIQLLFGPMIGAIAAGNAIVLKPSELAPATAKLVAHLVPKYLAADCYHVYIGGVAETSALLAERFDYIFFTGSTMVGRIIHAAANKWLTPVTLELGGKSPVYLDDTVDIKMAATRILWGKCTNAGQICIAPDYLLCTAQVQEHFVAAARDVLKRFYPGEVRASKDYARIVTERHFTRLATFLKGRDNIAVGGAVDEADRFIEPTILTNVSPNELVMQEEIFGPILPIVVVRNLQEAVDFINAREKPLALYVFTNDARAKRTLLERTSSGGVAINDTLMHVAVDTLPFGGVGFSGMGAYHGAQSFETFAHRKSVLDKNNWAWLERLNALRYAPYSSAKTQMLRRAMVVRREFPFGLLTYLIVFLLGVFCVLIMQRLLNDGGAAI